MGKHTKKSKTLKKKKSKQKIKYKSSSSSSSEEEWVEKKVYLSSSSSDGEFTEKNSRGKQRHSSNSEDVKNVKTTSTARESCTQNNKNISESNSYNHNQMPLESLVNDKREEWMSLPTSFITSSTSAYKQERNELKKLEREKQQYNPKESVKELNPYWKDGGDGLPKFIKPKYFEENEKPQTNIYKKKGCYIHKTTNWKKTEIKGDILEATDDNTAVTNLKEDDSVLSETELNVLGAKLIKAEIMGNTVLIEELKEKLKKARSNKNVSKSNSTLDDEILLTHTDSQGQTRPVKLPSDFGESSKHRKRKINVDTHTDGQRVKYFADDDKYSLKQMFENEKFNSVENQNKELLKMRINKTDDLDDIFMDNIRKKESSSKVELRNKNKAVNEHQKISRSLDNCNKCIQSEVMSKHLMISMGETIYLALPAYEPLTEGHCLIVPIRHVQCATHLDENEWSEVLDIQKKLIKFFKVKGENVVFFECAMFIHKFPHMCIECIPLPKEHGEMAPIYFKKAIDESETEWAENKKLISLQGKDLRKTVPRGMPYFSVFFGIHEGYAHVIEDERLFPVNFAQEIIGGMLDLHHSKWRKPKKQSFNDQSKRALKFSNEWKKFNC